MRRALRIALESQAKVTSARKDWMRLVQGRSNEGVKVVGSKVKPVASFPSKSERQRGKALEGRVGVEAAKPTVAGKRAKAPVSHALSVLSPSVSRITASIALLDLRICSV